MLSYHIERLLLMTIKGQHQKNSKKQHKKAYTGQRWDNLNFSKDNNWTVVNTIIFKSVS